MRDAKTKLRLRQSDVGIGQLRAAPECLASAITRARNDIACNLQIFALSSANLCFVIFESFTEECKPGFAPFNCRRRLVMPYVPRRGLSAIALSVALLSYAQAPDAQVANSAAASTTTPIKHLIVVIGENHTLDNLFGGYKPPRGQRIRNLLSEGIINEDGSPGPNFAKAVQQQAGNTSVYRIDPIITGPFAFLPQPQTTYATGLPPNVPDVRFPADLPPGPFQITRYVPYDSYTGDPPHRLFQMWQQVDEGKHDLFAWVSVVTGIGPDNSFNPPDYGPNNTLQGGEALGFYNMSTGDAPKFKALALRYALSDNYHQAVMGGTGANFLAIATGDVAYFNTGGVATKPFDNQIENPAPQHGTNNWYTKDGYTGGSYVNCADESAPGVSAIMSYIKSQPGKPFRRGNCARGTYYLVNNYNLGYTFDGQPQPIGADHFTLPPQTIPTIADALSARQVSWKWYSGGREATQTTGEYCGICDPFTGFTSVMTTSLKQNLHGVDPDLYSDLAGSSDQFPAVAFVRPPESKAGHPANAKVIDFENFVADLVDKVKANHALWKHTAVLITVDEGGGYYDSSYIQPIDFFGDGTRIPLLAVSPWAKKGHVDHTYADHASILKFIEKNWRLQPLSARSRDNLPNPVQEDEDENRHDEDGNRQDEDENRYVPSNRPAIGDLMSLFNFKRDMDDDRDN
jgi:phospholipase C